MGAENIKLLAMIGAFLGWPSIPVTLFLSSFGGSIIGLSAMLIKGVAAKYALPFAPFLCLGALLHLFFRQGAGRFIFLPTISAHCQARISLSLNRRGPTIQADIQRLT